MFIMYEQHMWGKIRLFISESRLDEHRASLGSASLLVKHHQTVLVTVAAQGTRVGVSGVSYHVLATMSWVGGRAGVLDGFPRCRHLSSNTHAAGEDAPL